MDYFPPAMQKPARSRGRPAHEPTDKNRQVVELMAAYAVPQDKIAEAIAIDPKSLRQHYRRELDRGSAVVEAKLVGNLLRLAGGSDGVALKAVMFSLQSRFGWSMYAPPPGSSA
jgi:hypothetical protein